MTDLAARLTAELDERLAAADAALAAGFPGERPGRQPVHTVYIPADRYDARTVATYGAAALQSVDDHAQVFADLVQDDDLVQRVRRKLEREPVEDLRIDFEDGYVGRDDAQETQDVERTAQALAETRDAQPYSGIRVKCFEAPTRSRSLRTLTAFVEGLGSTQDWVVTLPKVTSVDQVEAMVHVAEALDVRFEVQVETPQSILGPDGTALVARMVHAGGARLTGLHYGTYDYSAFVGIVAAHQSLEHPAADHAKLVMQAAAAGTGVRLSDGSTNVLPVGTADEVGRAWANHARLVRRSLAHGYYQGWDLHPAHLPTRYAATYAFYREGLDAALDRLEAYRGAVEGGTLDEPATVKALTRYVQRGLECGAVDPGETRGLVP